MTNEKIDITKLADICKIKLTDAEAERIEQELENIFIFEDILSDAEGEDAICDMCALLRDDEEQAEKDDISAIAGKDKNGYFKVPRVVR